MEEEPRQNDIQEYTMKTLLGVHTFKVGEIYGLKKLLKIFIKDGRHFGEAQCILCGAITYPHLEDLLREKGRSCMCQHIKHNLHKSRIYHTYSNIKYRCYNSNHHEYKNYGGKGITMCDEWLGPNGFLNFYDWAMTHGYSDDLTIDRIDSDKGYYPENCQWITRGENTTKSNKICQHRRANKGRYYGISPEQVEYEFDNANQFAREHNLNADCIRSVANKASKSHYGWVFGFVNERITNDTL